MNKERARVCSLTLLTLTTVACASAFAGSQDPPVKIGVLAKRGVDRCLEKWGPTAEYLTTQIPDQSFIIVPLDFDEICPVVERGEVDFVLANSSFYVELEARYGANRLATLKNFSLGTGYTRFGGVIFCRVDRDDIECLTDFKGKTFMAVKETSFGGWQMAWRELKEARIYPHRDFAELRFGGTHDAVVYAIRDGLVDAGTVRTDTLERMEAEGKIRLENFRVICERDIDQRELPCSRSTRLYPEWPFAKVRHTADELAETVAVALLGMSADSPAARAARCAGWTVPLNYQPVHECLKELRVGPYKDLGKITLGELVRQYWPGLVAVVVFLATAAAITVYVLRLNRRLEKSVAAERKELAERKRAEEALRASQQYTRELIEAHLDPLVTISAEGKIMDVNQASELITGYPRETLIGTDFSDYFTDPRKARQGYQQAFREKHVHDYPLDIKHRDGSVTPVFYNASVYHDTKGNVAGVFAAARDITERKRAEKALKDTTDLLQSIMDSSTGDIILATDPPGTILTWNEGARRLLGYEPEEVVGKETVRIFHTDEYLGSGRMDANINNMIASGKPLVEELTFINKNGEAFPVQQTVTPRFDEDGEFIGVLGLAHDITERKRAEKELRLFSQAVDGSIEGVAMGNIEYEITYANEAFARMFGYTREELLGRRIASIYSEEEMPQLEEALKATLKDGWTGELVGKRKDGTLFPMAISSSRIMDGEGNIIAYMASHTDITERKRSEETLREREELFRLVTQATRDAVYDWDIIADRSWRNERYCKLFEPPGPASYDWWCECIHADDRDRVEADLRRTFEDTSDHWSAEYRFRRTDGGYADIIDRGFIIRDADGHPIRMIGAMTDITERKQVERLLQIQRDLGIALVSTGDLMEALEQMLEAAFQIEGIDAGGVCFVDEVTGAHKLVVHGGLSPQFVAKVSYLSADSDQARLVRAGKPIYGVYSEVFPTTDEVLLREGVRGLAIIPVLHEGRAVATLNLSSHTQDAIPTVARNAMEAIAARVGSVIARGRMLEALRESEELFRTVVDASKDAMVAVNRTGLITIFNPAAEKMFGYKIEEMIDQPLDRLIPEEHRSQHQQYVKDYFTTGASRGVIGKTVELPALRSDGTVFPVELSLSAGKPGGEPLVLAVIRDITERRWAEETLRKQTEILENVLAHIPHSVFWKDMKSVYLGCNENFAREAGLATPEQIIGKTDYDLPWSREQTEFYIRCDREVITAGRPLINIEEPQRRADSSQATLMTSKTPLRDLNGQIIGVLGIYADITERKRAEETLRRQALVFGNLYDGVLVVGPEGRITDWNPGAERIFGYTKEQILGKSPELLNRPSEAADLTRGIQEGLARDGRWSGEVNFIRADRTEGVCEVVCVPFYDEDSRVLGRVSVNRDITDRLRAEEELQRRRGELAHISRLATMGEMATGLAHALNQPLAAILYYARGCGRRMQTGDYNFEEVVEVIEKVAVQAERAAAFIERLRSFVRKGSLRLAPVDLNLIVREAVGFAEYEARENGVIVDFQLGAPLPPVLADIIQIEQVVLNVVRNGIEAMRESELGRRRLTIQTSYAGSEAVACAVVDTGCGCSEEVAEQLFDAFFTTKPDGMGMGLAISRSIIEAHGGRLWAAPNPGGGTAFRFTLPVSRIGQRHEK